ncbi:MAG TPA: ABC transporter substrate-binding protein [Dehalococcoidia bacterium]|nr:ABC transporter substrate-binding protein [Dehalococcoidia bacterium]
MTRPFDRLRRLGRLSVLLTPLIAIALVGAACASEGDATPEATAAAATATTTPSGPAATTTAAPRPANVFPLTITDSSGAAVKIAAIPERIISFSPAATEILFAIGAGDRVAGTDEFSDFPASALELPKLAYTAPDPEAALALDPDLIVMATNQRESVQQFRDLGMTVLFVEEADSVQGVLESIALFGRITDNESEATALVEQMTAQIDEVTAVVADMEDRPLVFYELSADLYTVGTDTFIGGMITGLKARNVAAGAESSFPQLSSEAVIEADPAVILLSDAKWGESAETVGARPGWSAMAAVVNGRIHPIDPDIVNRPGPRIAEGLRAMAEAIYPGRFQ